LQKRRIFPIVICLSVIFNIVFVLGLQSADTHIQWPFADLGPAIIQDSYYIRAPGLESPYGVIGDIPGGYSLYLGNPLQIGDEVNVSLSRDHITWSYGRIPLSIDILILALAFVGIPVGMILIGGRRSYGSSKTR